MYFTLQNDLKPQHLKLGWQKIYDLNPYKILSERNISLSDDVKKTLLGGETAMWGEQVSKLYLALISIYIFYQYQSHA